MYPKMLTSQTKQVDTTKSLTESFFWTILYFWRIE